MSFFMPTFAIDNVVDIKVETLKNIGVKLILLDVDETLAFRGSQDPFEGVIEWTHEMRKNNIDIIIVSNNLRRRVAPFAKKFDLKFVFLALKPTPFGFIKAKRILKTKAENIVVIGDQVFTDVLGANIAGMKSILLTPRSSEVKGREKFKRRLEKKIREKVDKLD